MGECRSWSQRLTRARTQSSGNFLSGDYVFPIFHNLALAPPSQPMIIIPWATLTGKHFSFLTQTSLCRHPSPPCLIPPPRSAQEWTSVSLGSMKLQQFPGEAPQMTMLIMPDFPLVLFLLSILITSSL